jgi:protein TonB
VFLILLLINASREEPEKKPVANPITFEIKQEQKVEKKVEQKPRPKPRSNTPPPPIPSALLSGNLSGIDFGLSGFAADEIGEVDEGLLGNVEGVVMTGDMVDVKPRLMKQAPVEYPARAKAKEIEGFVVLSILINEEGRVEEVQVLEADPVGYFEKQAIRTIENWLFEPAMYKGKPVQTWANQTIRFELG